MPAALLVHVLGKVETAEAHVRAVGTLVGARSASGTARAARRNVVGIETVLVVDLALFRVAQNVVGFLNRLEAFFGGLVAWIQVGMVLARQTPVSLADFSSFAARATPRIS